MVYVSTRWYTFQLYDIIKFTFLRFLFFSLKQITKISVRSNKRTRPKRDYYSTKETVLVRSSIVLHNCCVLKYHSLFCFYPSRYILLTCDWLMTLKGIFIKGDKKYYMRFLSLNIFSDIFLNSSRTVLFSILLI